MYSLSAFKTYEIRGIWQQEVDEKFGNIMWYALGLHLVEKYWVPKILIASDVREANIVFMDHFLNGMREAGVEEVTLIWQDQSHESYKYGVCSTPMAYYAANEFDCACIFTASHNPSEYVGIKIVDKNCLSIESNDLRMMFENHEHDDITKSEDMPKIIPHDGIRTKNLLADIKGKFSQLKKIPKITIDYSHGAAVHFEQEFLRETLTEAVHIFTTPDGRFPAHETDTSRFANYQPLLAEIQRNGSDFGFIFDGDGDRFGMIIPDGTVVTGDILLSIVAKQLMTDGTAERLGSKVIFQEVFCWRIVRDTVEKYGGELRITRVGREKFVREVVAANGLLAGEVSTHLLFKEYGTIEMPLAGLFYLLKALENYNNASAMIAEFNTYARGQVFQFITDKKDELIEALKVKYAQHTIITIDGVRVEAPDWWFCVRKSWTEPMLKVAIEGKDKATYDSILSELRTFFVDNGAVEKL